MANFGILWTLAFVGVTWLNVQLNGHMNHIDVMMLVISLLPWPSFLVMRCKSWSARMLGVAIALLIAFVVQQGIV